MLVDLYQSLHHFKSEFSRQQAWLLFCAIILSFLAATEMGGVTSMCRYWLSDERGYHRLLHFFRAGSYHPERLRASWHRWVLSHAPLVEVAGRSVVLGDHTHVVKDGGRMPGVVSLRETSETQSKPDYFRGQCWGAVGLLVGSLSACFCLPLSLQIHQGFRHLGEEDANDPALKLGTRVVQMALSFALGNGRPVWLVLDAFFATASVFRLARSVWSVALQQPLVQVITRAKKNYVAYFPAPPKPSGRRGRQRQYGMKLVLWEAFDHADFFHDVTLCIYGKEEPVRLMSHTLWWKPLGQPLQFVWAVTSRGPILLMCSDLALDAETILTLYCRRTRIETLFNALKNTMGAFRFHFWSRYLPRHSRRPTANRHLKAPQPQHLPTVVACWQAMETFVLCACIATGLLQLFSLQYHQGLWKQQVLYLRTRSRELPSENTVRQILAPLLARQLLRSPPKAQGERI